MMKFKNFLTSKDHGVLKYTVLVNDDVFEIITDYRLRDSVKELSEYIGCKPEEIQQIELDDYEK